MPFAEIYDRGIRKVRELGLKHYRRGHIGHSVGISRAVEEPPFFGPRSTDVLAPGMVVSLEIPYYSRETGGLNIEDMLVVTETGAVNLTTLSKELTALPAIG